MKSNNFFAELKRRNVYKVAVAYAVVAWLVIQVASIVLPTFHAPEWTLQVVIALVVIGFPAALVCSWAFEITPEEIGSRARQCRERSNFTNKQLPRIRITDWRMPASPIATFFILTTASVL